MKSGTINQLVRIANDPNASKEEREQAKLALKNIRVSFTSNTESRLAGMEQR